MINNYSKRFLWLALGQIFSGLGLAAMIQANIGLDPWNVLHMGFSQLTGVPMGTASIIVGVAAISIAALAGERFGFGTIVNAVVPGLIINLLQAFEFIPLMHTFWSGALLMLGGLLLLSIGTYYYLVADLGAGPRDSLMVAIARKTKLSVGFCCSSLQVCCVASGWLLGGKVGFGTIFTALVFGPLLQLVFTFFHYDATDRLQETFGETCRNLSALLLAKLKKA